MGKAWYKSKTIWGAVVLAGNAILKATTGVELAPDELNASAEQLTSTAVVIADMVGVFFVVWGRIKATVPIN